MGGSICGQRRCSVNILSTSYSLSSFVLFSSQLYLYAYLPQSNLPTCSDSEILSFVLVSRNRRSRETSILDAIKDGAETLYEIVEQVYPGLDLSLRFAAAYNVRLHVEHLAQNGKLPAVNYSCTICVSISESHNLIIHS